MRNLADDLAALGFERAGAYAPAAFNVFEQWRDRQVVYVWTQGNGRDMRPLRVGIACGPSGFGRRYALYNNWLAGRFKPNDAREQKVRSLFLPTLGLRTDIWAIVVANKQEALALEGRLRRLWGQELMLDLVVRNSWARLEMNKWRAARKPPLEAAYNPTPVSLATPPDSKGNVGVPAILRPPLWLRSRKGAAAMFLWIGYGLVAVGWAILWGIFKASVMLLRHRYGNPSNPGCRRKRGQNIQGHRVIEVGPSSLGYEVGARDIALLHEGGWTMTEVYAGLDVSDKSTEICVVDASGATVWTGRCATDPDAIARALKRRAPGLVRVILETGPLSAFLYHGLIEREVAAVCVCARHAKGVLSARVNKSDVHDAEGLAQMARTGWFKAIHIKAEATHMDRAALKVREQLVDARQAMAGQLRGLLKLFGLRLGAVTTPNKRQQRLKALFALRPELEPVLLPLVESLEAVELRISRSSRQLAAAAAADPVAARLMSAPGVGPICALTFKSSIEDPDRFERGEDVGAFAGLAPRRSQSGERDVRGRISKAGDPMLRSALYEAANSLLGRVKRPCPLRAWGLDLVERKGAKRARVAVARKLAILLHRLWQSNTEFRWA